MYYIEEILAIVLAALLGVALLTYPTAIYRLQFFVYGADTGRRGRYGEAPEPSDRTKLLIRGIGVLLLGFAGILLVLPWL